MRKTQFLQWLFLHHFVQTLRDKVLPGVVKIAFHVSRGEDFERRNSPLKNYKNLELLWAFKQKHFG